MLKIPILPSSPNTQHIVRNSTNPHLNEVLQLLVNCCKTNPNDEDIDFITSCIVPSRNLLETQGTSYNIQSLITLASSHGILPIVYTTLKSLSESHPSLKKILSEIKPHYMSIVQRNMLMTSELIRIMQLLEANNIHALAFKGPSLAQIAYGDITLRQYGDLDILIKKHDRSKMVALLLKEHYIPEIDLKVVTKESFLNAVNVIAFYKKSSGSRIEIHWQLLSRNYAIDWEDKSLWEKQESIQINHKEIPVLSFEQLLLYLCTHGAKHLFERLEWVCDIDRSVRENPNIDWKYLHKEAEKMGIKRMLYLGLALCQEFFGLKLPKTIEKKISYDQKLPKLISKVLEMNFSETPHESKSYSSFFLLWDMRENFSDKFRFAWWALFAPKFDDFVFILLPKNLTFLYPFVRPYRLITKYFKH